MKFTSFSWIKEGSVIEVWITEDSQSPHCALLTYSKSYQVFLKSATFVIRVYFTRKIQALGNVRDRSRAIPCSS